MRPTETTLLSTIQEYQPLIILLYPANGRTKDIASVLTKSLYIPHVKYVQR